MLKLFFRSDGWQCPTLASSIGYFGFSVLALTVLAEEKYVASLQSDGCRCFLFHSTQVIIVQGSRAKALLRVHLRRQDRT